MLSVSEPQKHNSLFLGFTVKLPTCQSLCKDRGRRPWALWAPPTEGGVTAQVLREEGDGGDAPYKAIEV